MFALATQSDVEARLGRDLTDVETLRIDAVLDDASNSVRAFTGQQFDVSTTTDLLRVHGCLIPLPQKAVTAVGAVTTVDGATVAFSWTAGDQFVTITGSWFLGRRPKVRVTYTHGYSPFPDDAVGVTAGVAARALGTTPDDTLLSEQVTDYQYTRDAALLSGAYALLDDEKRALSGYLRPAVA